MFRAANPFEFDSEPRGSPTASLGVPPPAYRQWPNFAGVTKRCGGRRKIRLGSNFLFFGRASITFIPLADCSTAGWAS